MQMTRFSVILHNMKVIHFVFAGLVSRDVPNANSSPNKTLS